eukprot:jgi/Mesvir1/24854/Mv22090-RA.1
MATASMVSAQMNARATVSTVSPFSRGLNGRAVGLPMLKKASRSTTTLAMAAKDTGAVHVVRAGDWLSTIAPAYNITTEELRKANAHQLTSADAIYPGMRLVIPKPAQATPATAPKEAPSPNALIWAAVIVLLLMSAFKLLKKKPSKEE